MIYYIFFVIYILLLFFACKLIKDEKISKIVFVTLSCIGVILFQGLRSFSVGIDLKVYIPAFRRIGEMTEFTLKYNNFEPGFVVLNKLLYMIGLNERLYLIFITMIIQIPIFYIIYKYSKNPIISLVWYFSLGNFLMTFSGLRQSIAMSLCFLSYKYIKEKKLYKFLSLVTFAMFFHKSAILCYALYPMYYLKINRKYFKYTILLILIIFIFNEQIFNIICIIYTGHQYPIVRTNAYLMLIGYLGMYILSFYKKENDDDIDFNGMRNILLILVLIFCFAPLSNTFTRIGYPLTLYMAIYFPVFLDSFELKYNKIFNTLACMLLMLYFFHSLGYLNTLPFNFLN